LNRRRCRKFVRPGFELVTQEHRRKGARFQRLAQTSCRIVAHQGNHFSSTARTFRTCNGARIGASVFGSGRALVKGATREWPGWRCVGSRCRRISCRLADMHSRRVTWVFAERGPGAALMRGGREQRIWWSVLQQPASDRRELSAIAAADHFTAASQRARPGHRGKALQPLNFLVRVAFWRGRRRIGSGETASSLPKLSAPAPPRRGIIILIQYVRTFTCQESWDILRGAWSP